MRDIETYERRTVRTPLVLLLITITLIGIVVYLIYFGEPVEKKMEPSPEAIATLNRTVEVFSDVEEYTRLKNANDEYARIVKSFSEANDELYDAYVNESEENRRLNAYVCELEMALMDATNVMESIMEMLDGR